MKKISLLILAVTLTIASCKNYDDEFKDLNAAIAQLQTQVAGFSSLQASLTALQTSVASLQTAVNAIPTTTTDLSGLEADLTAALANIAALQADLNTVIANYSTSTDLAAAQADIDALTAALATAQAGIDELLSSNNVYDGDLTISSAAQLTFAQSLGNKVAIINGTLTVSGSVLTAAAVNVVTSKIVSVTGNAFVTLSTGSVDLSALSSVGGNYTVSNKDALDAALTSVGGIVDLDYDGGYSQPNLASAASLVLTPKVTTGTTVVGTLMVDFSGLTVATPVTASTTFASATSVKLKNAYSNIIANSALTVDMLAANYVAGLTVSATKAASVITVAGRVDDGATTPVGQALSVTGSATSVLNAAAVTKVAALTVTAKTVDFTALTTAAAVTLTSTTTVAFPALTSAAIVTANTAVAFTAANAVVASLDAALAKDISLASTATLNAAALENMTFTALAASYASGSTVKTVNITGKLGATNSFTSTGATLASATFAGELDFVSITGVGSSSDKLTTLTTTGAIDAFTLDDSDVITSISLGHSHIAGGAGSVLVITNNAELAALTTSTNYLRTLSVVGNAKLATMNFASYVNVPSGGAYGITITGNKLSGAYSKAVAATGTTSYVETVITSTSLTTLKPWINAYKTANTVGTTLTETSLTMSIDMLDVDAATGNQSLSSTMQGNGAAGTAPTDFTGTTGDTANYTRVSSGAAAPQVNVAVGKKINVTAGINIVYEFLLIQ